jgi:hypothetical protein
MTTSHTLQIPFEPFPKIPRYARGVTITEKLDGTNASIYIDDEGRFLVGSRTRWITPGKLTDNYGFAAWALENKDELMKLGHGHHFGEWWGVGIQRQYGLGHRRFSLFNTARWSRPEAVLPACCSVVPVLYSGDMAGASVSDTIDMLRRGGSVAAPGFMDPEGIVVFHHAAKAMFKVTLDGDGNKGKKNNQGAGTHDGRPGDPAHHGTGEGVLEEALG